MKSNLRISSSSGRIFCIIGLFLFVAFKAQPQDIPRPEHPEPQFERSKWINLNGSWDFTMQTKVDNPEENWKVRPLKFESKIKVPFTPECKLSGIGYTDFIMGAWTAPTDGDLKNDILLSMAAGFNSARLHQKVFEPRFHYWADKLGYLTWAEFADWGGVHNFKDREGLLNQEHEWRQAILRDRNHPSIVAWTPLNETSGAASNDLQFYREEVKPL